MKVYTVSFFIFVIGVFGIINNKMNETIGIKYLPWTPCITYSPTPVHIRNIDTNIPDIKIAIPNK